MTLSNVAAGLGRTIGIHSSAGVGMVPQVAGCIHRSGRYVVARITRLDASPALQRCRYLKSSASLLICYPPIVTSEAGQIVGWYQRQVAVFDLDGTLLAGDSTGAWLRMLLGSSWVRCIFAAMTLPATVLLLWFPKSRRVGASILLWIATVGYDRSALATSIERFAKAFEAGMRGLRWRNDGLAVMERHLAAGDRVLVVTAAPVWLAERLLASRTEVHVLGSTLARHWGGWIIDNHCHGREKCGMLESHGYGTAWDYAYTDSYDDAPLLAAANKHGFIVNARPGVVARLEASGQSHISQLRWI